MSASSNEANLLASLTWSYNEYSLAEFLERFQLPQVVHVEVGFFNGDETTSLAYGQVVALHSVGKINKLVCETASRRAVVIPLDCPLKVLVLSQTKDCKLTKITADQLISVYGEIQYVRVLKGGCSAENQKQTLRAGDILEIKGAKRDSVKCENVTSNEKLMLPFDCPALFTPLLDHKWYTLAEVVQRFGIPSKVVFQTGGTDEWSCSGDVTFSMSVSSLGEVTLLEEIEESVVTLTTVGHASSEDKVCLQVPENLPIQVAAANGLVHGEESYKNVVMVLDKQFRSTALRDFKSADTYEDVNVVRKQIREMKGSLMFEQSSEIQRKLPELRSRAFQDEPVPLLPRTCMDSFERCRPSIVQKSGQKLPAKSASVKSERATPKRFKSSILRKINRDQKSCKSVSGVEVSQCVHDQAVSKPGRYHAGSSQTLDNSNNTIAVQPSDNLIDGHIYEEPHFATGRNSEGVCFGKTTRNFFGSKIGKDKAFDITHRNSSNVNEQTSVEKLVSHLEYYEEVDQETRWKTSVEQTCVDEARTHSMSDNDDAYEEVDLQTQRETSGKAEECCVEKAIKQPKKKKCHAYDQFRSKFDEVGESRDCDRQDNLQRRKEARGKMMKENCLKKGDVHPKKISNDVVKEELTDRFYEPTDYLGILQRKDNTCDQTAEDYVNAVEICDTREDSVYEEMGLGTTRAEPINCGKKREVMSNPRRDDAGCYQKEPLFNTKEYILMQRSWFDESFLFPKPREEQFASTISDKIEEISLRHDASDGPTTQFPKTLNDLTVAEVGKLLIRLGMSCYAETFQRQLVDGEMLESLDQESLKCLGLNAFHVTKLLKFIKGWRPVL